MDVDLRGSSLAVRAYYRVWTRLPYVREGMIGVGVYALSEDGRRRFEAFPDVIADDGYVRTLFGPSERVRVEDAPVRVYAPERLSDLVRIKTRSRLGRYELGQRFPDLVARERTTKSYRNAVGTIVVRPWLWPAAIVYAAVVAPVAPAGQQAARRPSTSYVWERDRVVTSARPALTFGDASSGPAPERRGPRVGQDAHRESRPPPLDRAPQSAHGAPRLAVTGAAHRASVTAARHPTGRWNGRARACRLERSTSSIVTA